MKSNFRMDYFRFTQGKQCRAIPCILRMAKNYELSLLWLLRKYQAAHGIAEQIWKFWLSRYKKTHGVELVCKNIGGGLRLIHPYGITVNSHSQLGENITLYKGVTIGMIETGKKAGNPILESNVTVFANATICGNICIGHNSVIAPNAFVNFDVPPNSVVIGNPGTIHQKHSEEENT